MKKPIVLVIMDGVGRGDGGPGDAVAQAKTPVLDRLMATCPMTWLKAHGTAVGLPTDDDMGNSEVGHNALGCGQIYSQGAKLVQESIESGALFQSKTWLELASAFGGGLAGTRNTCGAVSGLAMAYGLLRGYADPQDKEAKREVYAAVHGMAAEFERINGSIICRELLGLGRDVNYVPPSDRSTEYYKKRPCPKLCACAAGILAQYLETHP